MAGRSLARVQAGDIARPVEQARVRRDELVALQSGREDEAVSGITVQVAQSPSADGDGAVYGNLNQAVAQEGDAPGSDVRRQIEPALPLQYAGLSEGDGGDGGASLPCGAVEDCERMLSELRVPETEPEQDVCVEKDHGLSTRSGSASASRREHHGR